MVKHIWFDNYRRHITVLVVLTFASLALSRPARAANEVVSDCGDTGGPNQLRAKLTAMQSSSGGTLTFSCGPATIVLNAAAGTLPPITTDTTIDGGGTITISGNNAARHFMVQSGGALTLRNITLIKGYSSSGDGGSIFNSGSLTIESSRFDENTTAGAYSGGAIVSYGSLIVDQTTFALNSAGNGGAIYPRFSAANTIIRNSRFISNQTTNSNSGWGGAILLWDGALVTVINSSFESNTANAGGAIYVFANSGLTIEDSAFINNVADGVKPLPSQDGQGGGIYNEGSAVLTRIRMTGNLAYSDGGGISNRVTGKLTLTSSTLNSNNSLSFGGGVYQDGGNMTLTNVTLSGNQASGGGGLNAEKRTDLINVTISGSSGSAIRHGNGLYIYLTNVILADSNGDNCTGFSAPNGITATFSISDDTSCGFGAGRDNRDALLGPLANNGGPTLTHLPGLLSPAIDAGTGAGAPATDQRGIPRPQGSAVDMGAVEVQPALPPDKFVYVPLIVR